jgi:hypothetical protein
MFPLFQHGRNLTNYDNFFYGCCTIRGYTNFALIISCIGTHPFISSWILRIVIWKHQVLQFWKSSYKQLTVNSDKSFRPYFLPFTRKSATPTVQILVKFHVLGFTTISTLVLGRNNIHSIRRLSCSRYVLLLLTLLVFKDCTYVMYGLRPKKQLTI